MKYKLIDVIRQTEENVAFGTCELCQYTGTLHYDLLVFQDENGNKYTEENGFWSWGDYTEYWWIDNYVCFADFITGRDYPESEVDEYQRPCLKNVIDQMYEEYSEEN